jgi:hypothetical protein
MLVIMPAPSPLQIQSRNSVTCGMNHLGAEHAARGTAPTFWPTRPHPFQLHFGHSTKLREEIFPNTSTTGEDKLSCSLEKRTASPTSSMRNTMMHAWYLSRSPPHAPRCSMQPSATDACK